MIRAEALSNHATVVKELVGVRAEQRALRPDLGTLHQDLSTLRQTVDALPTVIAQLLVERNRPS
jgi:hypothetical protein